MLSKLHKKVQKPKLIIKRKATDVLYDKMMFYNNKAEAITLYLLELIKNQATARGDLLVALHKELHRYNNIVIECASKLAPYQTPKLESIEVKGKITHRFVVQAPKPIADTNTWLNQTIIDADSKLITIPTIDESNTKLIEIN